MSSWYTFHIRLWSSIQKDSGIKFWWKTLSQDTYLLILLQSVFYPLRRAGSADYIPKMRSINHLQEPFLSFLARTWLMDITSALCMIVFGGDCSPGFSSSTIFMGIFFMVNNEPSRYSLLRIHVISCAGKLRKRNFTLYHLGLRSGSIDSILAYTEGLLSICMITTSPMELMGYSYHKGANRSTGVL